MDPIVGGAIIGGAGSLIGGAISARQNRKIANQQMQAQREFAQHGVQWRVEDAKAAGVHPLAALGMQGASYSPIAQVDPMGPAVADASQAIGRAVERTETPEMVRARQLNENLIQSQINENDARAGFYKSEAARRANEGSPGMPSNTGVMDESKQFMGGSVGKNKGLDGLGPQGVINLNPSKVVSGQKDNMHIEAGKTPALKEYIITGTGLPMLLPTSDEGPGETWGELSWYDKIGVIHMNTAHYGGNWLKRFTKEFMLGQERDDVHYGSPRKDLQFPTLDPNIRGREVRGR